MKKLIALGIAMLCLISGDVALSNDGISCNSSRDCNNGEKCVNGVCCADTRRVPEPSSIIPLIFLGTLGIALTLKRK